MSRRRQVDREVVEAALGGAWAQELAAGAADSRGPCPGRCNAAHRADPDGVEPVPGRPVWCWACRERIVAAVEQLPEDALRLASLPGGRLAASAHVGRRARSTAIVSPSGSPAWDCVDEVVSWAWSRASLLRQRLGQDPGRAWWARSSPPLTSLPESVETLTRHAAVWLAGPDAVDDGFDALRLHRGAEQAAGVDRLVHRLPAPCPYCDTLTLCREDGEEQVWCRLCDRAWPEADYRRLVRILADEAEHEAAHG